MTICFLLTSSPNFAYASLSCTTSYSPSETVNMGSINPYNYTNVVVPITMTVTCSGYNGPINYTHTVGSGSSGNMNARHMVYSSSNYVNYGVCTDTTCVQQYGDGTAGTMAQSESYTLSGTRADSWILYFVVPVQPLSVPGTYSDALTVTITVNW